MSAIYRRIVALPLVRQFEEGRLNGLLGNLATGYNEMNAEFAERESLRHFTRITSDIYSQLGTHFEKVFEAWAQPEEIEEVEP